MKEMLANLFLASAFIVAHAVAPMTSDAFYRDLAPINTVSQSSTPNAVVAVYLQSPDFTVREMKYRVFYNKEKPEGSDLRFCGATGQYRGV